MHNQCIASAAGANQVKFCHQLAHVLATAHDGDIRIWDSRVCYFYTSRHIAESAITHTIHYRALIQGAYTGLESIAMYTSECQCRQHDEGVGVWCVARCHYNARYYTSVEGQVFGSGLYMFAFE